MAGKANFARNAAEEGKLPRKKRPYDNQKRAAQAAYTRKSGQFKENGTSQKRVLDVVSRDICLCNWVWIYLFIFSLQQPIILFCPAATIWTRYQNLDLHPELCQVLDRSASASTRSKSSMLFWGNSGPFGSRIKIALILWSISSFFCWHYILGTWRWYSSRNIFFFGKWQISWPLQWMELGRWRAWTSWAKQSATPAWLQY